MGFEPAQAVNPAEYKPPVSKLASQQTAGQAAKQSPLGHSSGSAEPEAEASIRLRLVVTDEAPESGRAESGSMPPSVDTHVRPVSAEQPLAAPGQFSPGGLELQPPLASESMPERSADATGSEDSYSGLSLDSTASGLPSEPAEFRVARRASQQPDAAPEQPVLPSQDDQQFQIPGQEGSLFGYSPEKCERQIAEATTRRQNLIDNAITNIDLDITPVRRQGQADPAITDVRTWRNRDGEVVARGTLEDFARGRVVIEQADGETVRIPRFQLSDADNCFLSAMWGTPFEMFLSDAPYTEREWLASTFTWKASEVCNKPLYFEEVQLERYGHTLGLFQPVVSGAHFFLNIAVLPYKMAINPIHECQYPLGYYRPGNCAPWMVPPVPLSVRGGLAEAGVIVGGIFLLP